MNGRRIAITSCRWRTFDRHTLSSLTVSSAVSQHSSQVLAQIHQHSSRLSQRLRPPLWQRRRTRLLQLSPPPQCLRRCSSSRKARLQRACRVSSWQLALPTPSALYSWLPLASPRPCLNLGCVPPLNLSVGAGPSALRVGRSRLWMIALCCQAAAASTRSTRWMPAPLLTSSRRLSSHPLGRSPPAATRAARPTRLTRLQARLLLRLEPARTLTPC
mmetsp:Transcript_35025/g.79859  ORF Transcript_35025/g.79859 Transcript_35025/m.79859 type:complete len:216 (-) Transcript_35025:4485-5132(-)